MGSNTSKTRKTRKGRKANVSTMGKVSNGLAALGGTLSDAGTMAIESHATLSYGRAVRSSRGATFGLSRLVESPNQRNAADAVEIFEGLLQGAQALSNFLDKRAEKRRQEIEAMVAEANTPEAIAEREALAAEKRDEAIRREEQAIARENARKEAEREATEKARAIELAKKDAKRIKAAEKRAEAALKVAAAAEARATAAAEAAAHAAEALAVAEANFAAAAKAQSAPVEQAA